MKQSLQLRLGQNLNMTVQLQQAIRLLQLSSLELQQEVQEQLESNIMLELEDEATAGETGPAESTMEASNEAATDAVDIPNELPVDTSWDEIYQSSLTGPSSEAGGEDDFLLDRGPPETLKDHLIWQMGLSHFSERDETVALTLIDAINADGYLCAPVVDLHQGLQAQMTDIELDEVQAVLHRIQQFDPPGVAATDLQECLLLQLRQLPAIPHRQTAVAMIEHHLEVLGKKDLVKLKRQMTLSDEALAGAIAVIRSLNPYPGRSIAVASAQYIVPDVFVVRHQEGWVVSLNLDVVPKLRINPYYSSLVKRADVSQDNQCMKKHLQEARWFLKSLKSRSETLLKVARAIVERQQDFLDYGATSMKPLVLRDIAEAVGLHESTVSRVTTQKYMHTPFGIFEFKYFFSSHVGTDHGEDCSAVAIKAHIKELIEKEDKSKPFSDDQIAAHLKGKGIQIARRTVAKYREAMSISSSSHRRHL